MRSVVVYGAVTPPGRLRRAVEVVADALGDGEDTAEVIDLAGIDLPPLGRRAVREDSPEAAALRRFCSADAVVLASPVYRATYSGVLKDFLDHVPADGLLGRPVGVVAMGESAEHCLGVDTALRGVLAWFGALAMPTSVYLWRKDFDRGVPAAAARLRLAELARTLRTVHARLGRLTVLPTPLALAARPVGRDHD